MNTDTGRIYELRDPVYETLKRSAPPGAPELRHHRAAFERLVGELTADERAAALDLDAGATLVPVSEQVAQKVRLGERELERRTRRRSAAKAARKAQR
jgi:hypothetical protein